MRLTPMTFLAEIGDRTIVLDLARDRYLGLAPRLAHAARVLTNDLGSDMVVPPHLEGACAQLLGMGLVEAGEPIASPGPHPPKMVAPTSTLWPTMPPDGSKPTSGRGFLPVMVALAQVSHDLRRRPFHQVVRRIAEEPSSAPSGAEQCALDEFFAARPWFPAKPICRLDAPALCLHMRRRGHPANLVFGVKLEKFAAHCWVQNGARVLNEPHELAARFTPIMAA